MKKLLIILLLFFPVGCDINQETNLKCELSGWTETIKFSMPISKGKISKETKYLNINKKKKKLYWQESYQKLDFKRKNWEEYKVEKFDKDFIKINQSTPRGGGYNKEKESISINLVTYQMNYFNKTVELREDGHEGHHKYLKGACEEIK